MSTQPTVLIVPGLRDHVTDHWQTLLAAKLSKVHSVPPLAEDRLSCSARVNAIEQCVRVIEGPIIIVAHSAGAMMVAHWALHSTHSIQGALLATPADMETPMPDGYPTVAQLDAHGWLPIPRNPLPFPSILAASGNDPLLRPDRAQAFALAWGSRFIDLGEVGHLNPASGYGQWYRAESLIQELSNA